MFSYPEANATGPPTPPFLDTFLEATLLEATLRLHNRLSAAHAGVGSWPPPQVVRDGLRWRWFDLTWPFVLAGTALTVAAWLPLPSPVPQLPTLAQPPIAWERIETALETLEQSHLLQAKAVDMFREPLAQLQQRPSQQWYTHHILEASDTLRAQLEHALEALEHDIQQLTAALNSLGQLPASGPHASTQLHDSFNQARDQLTLGHLPLNEQVLDMLNRIDRDTLRGLSQSKLSDLKEQLRQGTAVIRDARRHSCYGREIPFAEQDHALATEPCPFERREPYVPRGQSGEKGAMIQQGMHWSGETGEREITRGPGSAPLALNPRPKQSRAERIEVIQGTNIADEHDDYTRKFSRSVPKVDPSQAHDLSPGGVTRVDGHRDTIVWKYHFTPQERDVLEYVFK